MTTDFQANDRARFAFGFTEDPAGAAISQQLTGRVPLMGVVRLPRISWPLPRDQAFAALEKGIKALPASAQSEAEAALHFVMDLAREKANLSSVITVGDRKPDGKLDITVEITAQMPGGDPVVFEPFTVTPPIDQALDAVGTALVAMSSAIPIPGAAGAVAFSFVLFRAALHALKIV